MAIAKIQTFQDIQKLIDSKIMENQTLEYKGPDALENYDKVAKSVSYFANSIGGLIIYGITVDKKTKLPQSIVWVDAKKWFEERIENVILSRLPRLERINIRKVVNPNNSSQVIFLVEVPESVTAPHMAPDGRYWRRAGSRPIIMPDDMVRDMMFRRQKPFLILVLEFINIKIENSMYEFTVRFFLRNTGNAIAKNTELTASFHNLDIVRINGAFKRIDFLRGGLPSIQFNQSTGVYYPVKERRTRVGEVTFKVKDNKKPITISFDLIAEDMDFIVDKYSFDVGLLKRAKGSIEKGQPALLIHKKENFT